jgi:hypothetical protein
VPLSGDFLFYVGEGRRKKGEVRNDYVGISMFAKPNPSREQGKRQGTARERQGIPRNQDATTLTELMADLITLHSHFLI